MKYPFFLTLSAFFVLVGCSSGEGKITESEPNVLVDEVTEQGQWKYFTNKDVGISARYPSDWNGMDFTNEGEFGLLQGEVVRTGVIDVNRIHLSYRSNPEIRSDDLESLIRRKIDVAGISSDYEVFAYPEKKLEELKNSNFDQYIIDKDNVSIYVTPLEPISHISLYYSGDRENSDVFDAFVESVEISL